MTKSQNFIEILDYVEYQHSSEIKHHEWMLQVMWQVLSEWVIS